LVTQRLERRLYGEAARDLAERIGGDRGRAGEPDGGPKAPGAREDRDRRRGREGRARRNTRDAAPNRDGLSHDGELELVNREAAARRRIGERRHDAAAIAGDDDLGVSRRDQRIARRAGLRVPRRGDDHHLLADLRGQGRLIGWAQLREILGRERAARDSASSLEEDTLDLTTSKGDHAAVRDRSEERRPARGAALLSRGDAVLREVTELCAPSIRVKEDEHREGARHRKASGVGDGDVIDIAPGTRRAPARLSIATIKGARAHSRTADDRDGRREEDARICPCSGEEAGDDGVDRA
jgi:hypothetical protein